MVPQELSSAEWFQTLSAREQEVSWINQSHLICTNSIYKITLHSLFVGFCFYHHASLIIITETIAACVFSCWWFNNQPVPLQNNKSSTTIGKPSSNNQESRVKNQQWQKQPRHHHRHRHWSLFHCLNEVYLFVLNENKTLTASGQLGIRFADIYQSANRTPTSSHDVSWLKRLSCLFAGWPARIMFVWFVCFFSSGGANDSSRDKADRSQIQ